VKSPGTGSIFWFLAFAGVSYLYIEQLRKPAPSENDIVFGQKFYYEYGNDERVYVTGTMTGEGLAYPNNTTAVTCYKERKHCLYTSVEAIGGNQIGRMDAPSEYDVVKWDKNEIVAVEESMFSCRKTTITIARKLQQAVRVEEPINQTKPDCVKSSTAISKYTIESSPGWKKIFGK
jgi:hypothetical protein